MSYDRIFKASLVQLWAVLMNYMYRILIENLKFVPIRFLLQVHLPTVKVVEVFIRLVDVLFSDAVVCAQSAFPLIAGHMVPTFIPASDSVSVVL